MLETPDSFINTSITTPILRINQGLDISYSYCFVVVLSAVHCVITYLGVVEYLIVFVVFSDD